jgi:hypothetical protein
MDGRTMCRIGMVMSVSIKSTSYQTIAITGVTRGLSAVLTAWPASQGKNVAGCARSQDPTVFTLPMSVRCSRCEPGQRRNRATRRTGHGDQPIKSALGFRPHAVLFVGSEDFQRFVEHRTMACGVYGNARGTDDDFLGSGTSFNLFGTDQCCFNARSVERKRISET